MHLPATTTIDPRHNPPIHFHTNNFSKESNDDNFEFYKTSPTVVLQNSYFEALETPLAFDQDLSNDLETDQHLATSPTEHLSRLQK